MPCLLIDSSYVSFQCFFRTKKWFDVNYSPHDIIEWHNNKPFMEKYEKNYHQIIRRIVKNRKIPWENVIIVKDCPRDAIWRHDIYDHYKENRGERNKHFTGGLVFKYTHTYIFPFLEREYNCSSVRMDRAEADDIISIIHSEYRKKFTSELIFILSSDSDYVQLLDGNTNIINIYNNIIKKINNVEEYVLYKILNGDSSDYIQKVFNRRVSKRQCHMFTHSPDTLNTELSRNPDFQKRFNLNKKLILFENIPTDMKDTIIEWCSTLFPVISR